MSNTEEGEEDLFPGYPRGWFVIGVSSELAAGDVDPDAVTLAAGTAPPTLVAEPPVRPREVHPLHAGSMRHKRAQVPAQPSDLSLLRRSILAAAPSSRWIRATRSTWPLAGNRS